MDIICVGLNHETAPIAVREKLALGKEAIPAALQWLKRCSGIKEALIVSTCNRVEFYLVCSGREVRADLVIGDLFVNLFGLEEGEWQDSLYLYSSRKAVSHLFQVTAGMDSMVIGEPQITGQVKDAYRKAVDQDTLGIILNRLLPKSFSVSKRVRTETELAARAVSVSYVAVELAKKIFGDLQERTAMLAGAGEMAELAARHLINHGVGKILVASRTMESAGRLAETFQARAVPLDSLATHLSSVDILICSTGAPDYILQAGQIRKALRARKQNPVFIIDISVPRNIDPRADELDNVYLYDMDDLQKVLQTNLEERKKELQKAEIIVQEEVGEFLFWLSTLDLVPTIISLRERTEQIRQQEVEKALSLLKSSLDSKDKKVIDAMTRAIVNKVLHAPISELKQAEKNGDAVPLVEAVQRLFSLRKAKG